MEVVITPAVDPEAIAIELISKYHEHLEKAKILWLFTSQKMTRHGQILAGKANKAGALARYLSSGRSQTVDKGADFIILNSEEQWQMMTPDQRRAHVHHELLHLGSRVKVTKAGVKKSLYIKGHEIEAFYSEVERHGIWKPNLLRMQKVMAEAKQLEFPFTVVEGTGEDNDSKITLTMGDKKVETTGRAMRKATERAKATVARRRATSH